MPAPEGTRLSQGWAASRFLTDERLATVDALAAWARSRDRSLLELAMSWLASRRHRRLGHCGRDVAGAGARQRGGRRLAADRRRIGPKSSAIAPKPLISPRPPLRCRAYAGRQRSTFAVTMTARRRVAAGACRCRSARDRRRHRGRRPRLRQHLRELPRTGRRSGRRHRSRTRPVPPRAVGSGSDSNHPKRHPRHADARQQLLRRAGRAGRRLPAIGRRVQTERVGRPATPCAGRRSSTARARAPRVTA